MGFPTWMWHPTECREGRIVDSDEAAALKKKGWVDSPAKLESDEGGTPPAKKGRRSK